MEYRTIPHTDLSVSRVCLGTMTFGDRLDEAGARQALALAVERGVNFIDTADIYPPGNSTASEQILGAVLRPFRGRLVLATKAGGPVGPGPEDQGLGEAHLTRAVENSLRRLGTDCIDLYYAHFPDKAVSPEELIAAMNALIRAGKIRHYGVSNFSAWQICELVLKAREMGLEPPVASESVYNLLTRGIEGELIPMLRKYPLALVTYNPLAGGLLSGKYRSGRMPAGARLAEDKGYASRYLSDLNAQAVERLQALAQERGQDVLALSLQWLYAREAVTSVILGFSSPDQLRQNLDVLECSPQAPLPEEALDQVWQTLTGNRFSYHRR